MPQWVEDCIKEYMKSGLSKAEAQKRCYGAYEKRKKKEHKKGKK